MAALGFAVVVLDARGTPLRDKAFQEHCRGSRDGENLDDHVTAIRELAATRPWMDIDRVGIYGLSGGGRASTQALLRHPDFFKVAVSASGNHDDLLYSSSWGEKYIGFPEEPTTSSTPTPRTSIASRANCCSSTASSTTTSRPT